MNIKRNRIAETMKWRAVALAVGVVACLSGLSAQGSTLTLVSDALQSYGSAIDLTTPGSVDWMYTPVGTAASGFPASPLTRSKNVSPDYISSTNFPGAPWGNNYYGENGYVNFSWSDGTPSGGSPATYCQFTRSNQVTVLAPSTGLYQVKLYEGGYLSGAGGSARLTVTLPGATTYITNWNNTTSTGIARKQTFQFQAANAGDAFVATWQMTAGNAGQSGGGIQAVTLSLVPLTAGFTASPTNGVAPLLVTFTDTSTPGSSGTITNRYWDFGDSGVTNTTSTNLTHTYTGPGTNTVTLIVSDDTGASSTNTQTSIIKVLAQPVPPTASFSASPTNGVAPLLVTFTDTSTPGSGTITNRYWDFGDGHTLTTTNTTVTNTFASGGTNTVRLIVSDDAGVTATNTQTGLIKVLLAPPAALFSAAPTNGFAPLTVTFTDTSTPGSGTITNRYWSFGDGGFTNTTSTNLTYTYTGAGTNTVTLIVSDDAGNSTTNTQTDLIEVLPHPVPPAPVFEGSGISVGPGTGLAALRFGTTSGFEYRIVYKEDLLSTNAWLPVIPPSPDGWTNGTGGTMTITDPGATNSPQRFYRLEAR